MVSVGTMAMEESPRVDFDRMRRERQDRVFDAMAREGLDVLVLGREQNARYASGVRRLWKAGTRPFSPRTVIVRSTGETHLMSTWQDGMPREIPREHLYGMSWDPMSYVEALGRIEGVSTAARLGVDAMTPQWADLLRVAAPNAELVAAESTLRGLRLRKTADEVACIRTAVAITEAALSSVADALRPGIRERELVGIFDARMTEFGVTIPAAEGPFCVLDGDARSGGPRRVVTDRTIEHGELVSLCGGALYGGYEGSLGRTWPCRSAGDHRVPASQRELHQRWLEVWGRLAEVCTPGATGADLRAAYEASGEPLPPYPIAYSVGLGYDAPIAGTSLGAGFDAQWALEPGMVLAIQACVAGPTAGYVGAETVLVTEHGNEMLSTLWHGPLSEQA